MNASTKPWTSDLSAHMFLKLLSEGTSSLGSNFSLMGDDWSFSGGLCGSINIAEDIFNKNIEVFIDLI